MSGTVASCQVMVMSDQIMPKQVILGGVRSGQVRLDQVR